MNRLNTAIWMALILLSCIAFIILSNVTALYINKDNPISIKSLTLYIIPLGILSWYFVSSLENCWRNMVVKTFISKIKINRSYASPEYEGTHFGGAIEKYVWSSADLVKAAISFGSLI